MVFLPSASKDHYKELHPEKLRQIFTWLKETDEKLRTFEEVVKAQEVRKLELVGED